MIEIAPDDFQAFTQLVSNKDYHADKTAAQSSHLNQVLKSKKHLRSMLLKELETEEKAHFRWGRIMHMAVLEPEKLNLVLIPDFNRRTKIGKQEEEDFFNNLTPDAIAVTQEENQYIKDAVKSLKENAFATAVLSGTGMTETAIYWRDEKTKIKCKAKPDFFSLEKSILIDFKTSKDISTDYLQKSIVNYGYDLQMAHYRQGIKSLLGEFPKHNAWVFMESTPPYDVRVMTPHHIVVDHGEHKRRKAMHLISEIIQTDQWPGISKDIEELTYSSWKMKQLENEYNEYAEFADV